MSDNNKTIIIMVLLVAILGTSLFSTFATKPTSTAILPGGATPNTVTVTGLGEIIAVPDMAVVTLGVSTENKVLSAAYKENNTKMQTITDGLLKLGIKKEDIQTSAFNVNPTYDYTNNKSTLVGYQVMNNLTVSIRKIDDAGKILDSAIIQQANNIYNLAFKLSDTSKEYQAALEAAIKNAEDKAAAMTGHFNLKAVKPLTIKESSISNPSPIFTDQAAQAPGVSASVNPGSTIVSAMVEITFEIGN
ncbi:MAG: SIMPL domain-containing protein [Clostridia bacterium]